MTDFLVHAAYILLLSSYIVRDILWLRALTVVASLALMLYYFALSLWPPFMWNGLFLLINIYQIHALLLERRPCVLDERQEALYQLVFRTLERRDFLALFELGQWRELEPGERLIGVGTVPHDLFVIETGSVRVELEGERLAELGPGSFVGEMSFVSGGASSACVSAREPSTVLALPRAQLRAFLAEKPILRATIQLILSTDMAAKLRAEAELEPRVGELGSVGNRSMISAMSGAWRARARRR